MGDILKENLKHLKENINGFPEHRYPQTLISPVALSATSRKKERVSSSRKLNSSKIIF